MPEIGDIRRNAARGRAETTPHKPCPICGGRVSRGMGEDADRWKRRQACSKPCRTELRRRRALAALPLKSCQICKIEFAVRDDESPRAFKERKTCGAEECFKELASRSAHRNHSVNETGWWRETRSVDYAGGFARASRDPGDRAGPVAYRPATVVLREAST